MTMIDGGVGLRVMIVDDEGGLRRVVRRLLERQGIDVCAEAFDGVDAVEKVAAADPDVILMDLRMPRMDGIDATRAIKSHSSDIQIVLTSAYDDRALQEEAFDAGASAYVVKGSRAAELGRTLTSVCNRPR